MQLAICEFMNNNYIIHKTISLQEFYNSTSEEIISDLLLHYNYYLSIWSEHIPNYIYLQNYNRLIMIELTTSYEPFCIKTYYIRLIQRLWRKIYNVREKILFKRKKISSIRMRENTGKWPKSIRKWPKFHIC